MSIRIPPSKPYILLSGCHAGIAETKIEKRYGKPQAIKIPVNFTPINEAQWAAGHCVNLWMSSCRKGRPLVTQHALLLKHPKAVFFYGAQRPRKPIIAYFA